jgi:tetratricopeptide (TPR) repeat protein
MNAQPQSAPAAGPGANTVDERNPWLGLASFTEETRGYFYGRDEEVAELSRRVQRKLLTVLFGQSGLGKTSILRAGLAPRLRGQGYCPIYVRIDYGKESPEPAEQIKQAISRTARRSGEWTRAGVAVEGESLWEFLHHRDDVLREESGATLIPLLIFDQFEEIFTLAQSDDFGRARAARFIDELADLVENRPPKSLEAKLEEDESSAERFDFARGDYRVLIALREDYLAPLEGLKKAMPSISQNRLRLAPMTGEQALAAVVQPGKRLVTDEVAAAIVRFVAGGAELAHAEVEPSLLSLICRELNDTRIAQGRDEISLDLLAGSHASILSNFYERSLADQKPAVRQVIEDELLTTSGFRENIAEERLLSRFKAVGAAPGTLAILVNRRLLRIEERLDVRRVELTHDVLCGVVKSSRDLRREREAREATERLLAEQRSRELSARRALVRARQIAIGCTVLAVGALIAAVLAYISTQRARRAEVEAQETRATAEQARGQAEHLLGYLTDDFVRELESFGRLNVLAEFSQRQIDYFHALPPALKGSETTRNGALALVHHARAMRTLGNGDIGLANATEAEQLLERQRAAGDHSEATTIALALAYSINAAILDNKNDPAGPTAGNRASELLRPLAEAPDASVAARRAYVQVLSRIGYEQQAGNQLEAAVLTEQKSIRIATALGARDLTDLDMGAYYAESAAWMVSALSSLGRSDEARKGGADALAVADKVLERRPGFRLALHAEQIIESSLANVAQNDLNPAEAIRINERNTQTSMTLLKLDPNNVTSINNLGVADQSQGDFLWALGKVSEAIPYYLKSLDEYGRAAAGGAGFVVIRSYDTAITAFRQAQIGDADGSAATVAKGAPFLTRLRKSEPKGSMAVVIVEAMEKIPAAGGAFERDDLATALRIATDAVSQLQSARPDGLLQASQRSISLYVASHIAGRTEFRLGNFAAAQQAERTALAARKEWGNQATPDQRDLGEVSTWLAMSLARQGRITEAAQIIGPVVKFQRELAARNHGDKWQPLEFACALYAQSLTDKKQSAALLREAAGLVDGLPPTLRALHDVRLWRDLIQQAQKGAAELWAPPSGERSAG